MKAAQPLRAAVAPREGHSGSPRLYRRSEMRNLVAAGAGCSAAERRAPGDAGVGGADQAAGASPPEAVCPCAELSQIEARPVMDRFQRVRTPSQRNPGKNTNTTLDSSSGPRLPEGRLLERPSVAGPSSRFASSEADSNVSARLLLDASVVAAHLSPIGVSVIAALVELGRVFDLVF